MWFKSKAALGDFEQLVLLRACFASATRPYGAAIRQEIHARSGRDVSINAVYTTLDRLEARAAALVDRRADRRSAAAGGRKFYALTPPATAALQQAYRAFTAMADGLERRLEPK
jgi:DNA-binding PadR family transcriptional regulator